jgi:hypothetical protein
MPDMEVSRRGFLKIAGEAAAVVGLGGGLGSLLSGCDSPFENPYYQGERKRAEQQQRYLEVQPQIEAHFKELGLSGRHRIRDIDVEVNANPASHGQIGEGVATFSWYKPNDNNPPADTTGILYAGVRFNPERCDLIDFDEALKPGERFVDITVFPDNTDKAIAQYEKGELPGSLLGVQTAEGWNIKYHITLPNSDSQIILPKNFKPKGSIPVTPGSFD